MSFLFNPKAPKPIVKCATHGPQRWEGYAICSACERIYKIFGDGANGPQKWCECGLRFAPDGTDAPFTARVICNDCARQRLAH